MKKQLTKVFSVVLALGLCASLAPAAFAGSAYDRPGQKLVALTFDDGPGPYSDWIMDTLEARGAKATFFMNGYLIRRYPEAVKRMATDGFQLGNHTYNHPYLAKRNWSTIATEVKSTANLITSLTGVTGTANTGFYLRPPYGSYNRTVIAAAGVPVIWCTIDSGDWKYDSASRLVSYTGSAVRDGDIVIMHESHKSTAAGLGALVDTLQAQGYELVTLEELFWRKGITPQAGQIYYSAKNTGVNRCSRELYCDESKLSDHWAYQSIQYVRNAGYMSNNEYGEFTPNFPLTRGMFVTILGRLAGVKEAGETSGFWDVSSNSYVAPYAAWAKKNGIMDGVGEGKFSPDETLTRQQMAVAMTRYIHWDGGNVSADENLPYTDAGEIADWAQAGVAFCTVSGLLQGNNGTFQPNATTTRAMGASILQRVSKLSSAIHRKASVEGAEMISAAPGMGVGVMLASKMMHELGYVL